MLGTIDTEHVLIICLNSLLSFSPKSFLPFCLVADNPLSPSRGHSDKIFGLKFSPSNSHRLMTFGVKHVKVWNHVGGGLTHRQVSLGRKLKQV